MATLIVNANDLPQLSRKIVKRLERGSMGYEALIGWTGSSHQSVACQLHRLKLKGIVEHDGCRPRTWKLAQPKEREAA